MIKHAVANIETYDIKVHVKIPNMKLDPRPDSSEKNEIFNEAPITNGTLECCTWYEIYRKIVNCAKGWLCIHAVCVDNQVIFQFIYYVCRKVRRPI